jgi:ABC-2 type transport system permease protein
MKDSPAFREPGLASSVLKLLRLRMIILFNSFRRAKLRTKIIYAMALFGVLSLLGFSLLLSTTLIRVLLSPVFAEHSRNINLILESFPSIVMSIAGCGILFTSISVLLQALYLSDDMDFLMSAPVPMRAVFIAKLIQGVLPNFIILCVLALPALFGVGISSGYPTLYYPLVVLMMAAIALLAASLASVIILIAARYFPPRRMAEILGFIIGLTVFVSSQLAPRVVVENSNYSQMDNALSMLTHFNKPWLPLSWAGRGLVAFGKREWMPALGWISAALAFAGIIVYAALLLSERLYYSGWVNIQANYNKSKKQIKSKSPVAAASPVNVSLLNRILPAQISAILAKDLRLYRRDLRSLTGLLFPMILGVIYALGLLRSNGQMPVGRGNAPPGFIHAGNAVIRYADIGLAIFLGWMLIANLAGMAFSREGKNYWILKTAPISPRQLLVAKFLVGYFPSALICSIYLMILEILKRAAPWSILINLICVCIVIAGLTGIYLALGTRGAKFNWENPAQAIQTIGCIGMLISLLFLPIALGLFLAPIIVAELFHFSAAAGRLIGLLLVGIFCATAVILPLALVEKRIAFLSEN